MKYLLTAALVLLPVLAFAGHSPYPAGCDLTQKVEAQLTTKWGEAPLVTGLLKGGKNTLSVWLNPETGTWTVTVKSPDGSVTCVKASGTNFSFEAELAPTGAPA